MGDGIAFDSDHQVLVRFGGYAVSSTNIATLLNQTWTWNGSDWTQQAPTVIPPSRQNTQMAYDQSNHQVVLFGGDGQASYLADTWVWDGTNWQQKNPSQSPHGRLCGSMVYDSVRQQTVLFGGEYYDSTGFTFLSDTWVWNGTSWTQKFPPNTPRLSCGHSMAFDSSRGETVLYGQGQTWTWDGTNWHQQSPTTSPTFPNRFPFGLAFDASSGRTLLFGGENTINGTTSYLSDMWSWDGTNWTQISTQLTPSARIPSLAYDSARRQTVLFGEYNGSYLNDTWIWTSTTCVPPTLTAQPQSQTISNGQTATLAVTGTGTAPLIYQWFQGNSGTTTSQVGISASFTTPALTTTTSYWVRVTNSCGSTNSQTATITVTPAQPIPTFTAASVVNEDAR